MERARVIRAAETIAGTWELTEEEQVAALRQDGFEESEAHRLVALLPIAFSRPILEELGVSNFAPHVSAVDADGAEMFFRLARQPEYAAGLELARAHRKTGVMDHEVYKRVAGRCAGIDATSNALNTGSDMVGATIAHALVGTQIARHLIR